MYVPVAVLNAKIYYLPETGHLEYLSSFIVW
jgi:hypothetical protein